MILELPTDLEIGDKIDNGNFDDEIIKTEWLDL